MAATLHLPSPSPTLFALNGLLPRRRSTAGCAGTGWGGDAPATQINPVQLRSTTTWAGRTPMSECPSDMAPNSCRGPMATLSGLPCASLPRDGLSSHAKGWLPSRDRHGVAKAPGHELQPICSHGTSERGGEGWRGWAAADCSAVHDTIGHADRDVIGAMHLLMAAERPRRINWSLSNANAAQAVQLTPLILPLGHGRRNLASSDPRVRRNCEGQTYPLSLEENGSSPKREEASGKVGTGVRCGNAKAARKLLSFDTKLLLIIVNKPQPMQKQGDKALPHYTDTLSTRVFANPTPRHRFQHDMEPDSNGLLLIGAPLDS